MKRNITILLIYLVCFFGIRTALAQEAPQLSRLSRIYILHVAPGPDMYAVYGHTALWVSDEIKGINQVYDYGVFDFASPHFYTNFLMGNMRYKRAMQDINSFLMPFYIEEREVKAKQIFLDSVSKQKLFQLLWNNAQPGHDTYHYDFVKDNCATQLQYLIDSATQKQIKWNYSDQRHCLRELLFEDMDKMYWTQFGYDLLLGAGSDTILNPRMENFLPRYLFRNMGNAVYHRADLSGPNESVLNVRKTWEVEDFWYMSPIMIFSLVFFGILMLIFWARIPKWIDVSWFILLGLLGCLIFFMSNFTAHHVMKQNWNLLWTHPFLLAWPFLMGKLSKQWVRMYAQILCVGIGIALIAYPLLPQSLSLASLLINATSLVLLTNRMYPQFYQKVKQWRK